MNGIIVFFMREFGWSLEYTVNLVKTLPWKQLQALITETQYQRALEDYRVASNSAMIIATWASAQKRGRTYQVSDFIGHPPRRKGETYGLEKAAKEQGIIMPKGG